MVTVETICVIDVRNNSSLPKEDQRFQQEIATGLDHTFRVSTSTTKRAQNNKEDGRADPGYGRSGHHDTWAKPRGNNGTGNRSKPVGLAGEGAAGRGNRQGKRRGVSSSKRHRPMSQSATRSSRHARRSRSPTHRAENMSINQAASRKAREEAKTRRALARRRLKQKKRREKGWVGRSGGLDGRGGENKQPQLHRRVGPNGPGNVIGSASMNNLPPLHRSTQQLGGVGVVDQHQLQQQQIHQQQQQQQQQHFGGHGGPGLGPDQRSASVPHLQSRGNSLIEQHQESKYSSEHVRRAQLAAATALTPAVSRVTATGPRGNGMTRRDSKKLNEKLLKSPLYASFDEHFGGGNTTGGGSALKRSRKKKKKKKRR